jgi:cell division protein FtsI (penicillin-binding protein 3)
MTGQPRRRRIAAPRLRRRNATEVGVRRIRWTLLVYLLVALLAAGQLVHIQVFQADEYADRGVRQRARTIDLTATRGRIYDREGDVFATSVQAATVYGDPRAFRSGETPDGLPVPPAADPGEVAAELAPLIGRDAADIEERLTRDAHFVYLARQLDHDVGQEIADLGLPGIGILAEPSRVYPAAGLAGQVVGFTGVDGEGLQGLEAQYDQVLAGRPGMLVLERAPGGLDIAPGMRELVPPEAGTDLVLTLDREIQHIAEQAAATALEEYNASAAGVLVIEVGTGEIHGMASAPAFDPNERTSSDPTTWRNRTVTDVFEPGSTQKALTVAAALEEGIVTSDTVLTVPNGITVSGKRFTDAYPQPEQDLTVSQIMERSSNVGTIDVALELGEERLEHYLREFGYGRTTGLGFPGESDASVHETLALAKRLRRMSPDFEVPVFYYKPYPGSAITERVVAEGYALPATLEEWADFDFIGSSGPWVTPEKQQLIERFKFYNRFAWGPETWPRRALQAVARWRCQRDMYRFPIEKALVERLKPLPELS